MLDFYQNVETNRNVVGVVSVCNWNGSSEAYLKNAFYTRKKIKKNGLPHQIFGSAIIESILFQLGFQPLIVSQSI